jgi:GntR family transcriptional regulator / MocR family aminotransferase
MNESTGPVLHLRLDGRRPPGEQVESSLRELIRSGALPTDATLPSTRSLAADLGVSRGVVVRAYEQLAAEGLIALRPKARPVVAARGRAPEPMPTQPDVPVHGVPFVLRPDLPDLGLFPRGEWLRSARRSLERMADVDLAYGEPFGAAALRAQLAPFLARTRGVMATPDRTSIHAGSTQALRVLASVLRAEGARRIAVEDPGHRWRTRALAASGLEVVPVPVDREGLRVDRLGEVDAVVVNPGHHFPTGVALSPERRRALVEWAVDGDRLVLEHDYDGHFRYDRHPTGALQALAPENVAYVGSASALLAPTVRIGWAVVPARFVVPVANELFSIGIATSRLSQLTLAELVESGRLDRHLRRARVAYRRRRDVLVQELARRLPEVEVGGEPVGLFVSMALSAASDEAAILSDARARGIALDGVNEHCFEPQAPGLVLGFAATSEPGLARAVKALAAVVG